MNKPWYQSRMLWTNALAIVVWAVQVRYGFVIDKDIQAAIIAVVNIVLRLDTNTGIQGV